MERNKKQKTKVLLLSTLLGGALSACAPKKNGVADLSSAQIFKKDSDQVVSANTTTSVPTKGSSESSPGPVKAAISVGSRNLCSSGQTNSAGTNLIRATSGVEVRLFKGNPSKGAEAGINGATALYSMQPYGRAGTDLGPEIKIPAQDPIALRKDLINKKALDISLGELEPGTYYAVVMDKDLKRTVSTAMIVEVKATGEVKLSMSIMPLPGPLGAGAALQKLTILYDENPDQPLKKGFAEGETTPPPGEACDEKSSPLMVDMAHGLKDASFDMSAPLDGIEFDIDGSGVKHQISWPANPEANAFLALPDLQGEISSVNQLFGNRTLGPDGKMAENGFEALKKYDLNGDFVIDRRDSVYDDLRLWFDLNRNGVVDGGELRSLYEKNIKSISLRYTQIYEVDLYQNETLQRSMFEDEDGNSRMIVDIWFRKVF